MSLSVDSGQTMTKETARWIYQKMQEIRLFENKVHELFGKGILPGFVHLYAGEEAVAVGICAHLNEKDQITSTHRGHGHCIAKNCDLDGMMAEIYGKKTGLCKGKGGSMHIADIEKGMLGAGTIQALAVFNDDNQIVRRDYMPLSLTFDHRILDGEPASAFLNTIKSYLEKPYNLFV